MSSDLDKIALFLKQHHVMSLATSAKNELSTCNLFYVFSKESLSFIVASSDDTTHMKHIQINPLVAGGVVLETKIVGKIQGVQFKGKFLVLENKELKKLYFKEFPYAFAMNPKLWQIKIDFFKMTDNTLGFANKIVLDFSSKLSNKE